MPIYIGQSTANQKQIALGATQMQKVYVGANLVWSKTPAFVQFPATRGFLYNWFSANSGLNIAAAGYRAMTSADLAYIDTYLGGAVKLAGGQLKETGLAHWASPNTGASNSTGFTSIGTGLRYYSNGAYYSLSTGAYYWLSDAFDASKGKMFSLTSGSDNISPNNEPKQNGMAIILVKEDSINPGSYTGNDGRIYPLLKIGNLVITPPIAETLFRDLSPIPEVANASTWIGLNTPGRTCFENNISNALLIPY